MRDFSCGFYDTGFSSSFFKKLGEKTSNMCIIAAFKFDSGILSCCGLIAN